MGVSTHSVTSMPGDSGSVLLAGDGELVGMRVGVLEQVGTYHPVAINSRQLLAWMLKHDMLNKRKGGFLGSEKLDGLAAKASSEQLLPCSRRAPFFLPYNGSL